MRTFLPLFLLAIAALLLSACAGDSGAAAPLAGASNVYAEVAKPSSNDVQEVSELQSSSADVVVFKGTVFVATSELVKKPWKSAGWQISDQTIDTSQVDIPMDCTLYAHAGVANQWVGGCSGTVRIPRNGARDIAVRQTAEDGSNHVIQVAPAPGYP